MSVPKAGDSLPAWTTRAVNYLVRVSRLRALVAVTLVSVCLGSEQQTAAQLFREAQKAEQVGQTVRAYLLYAQAAAKDPSNMTYWSHAQALRPIASMAQPGVGPLAGVKAETPSVTPETGERPKASEIDPTVVGSISSR